MILVQLSFQRYKLLDMFQINSMYFYPIIIINAPHLRPLLPTPSLRALRR
jgi:hypothetical protein